jgi:hypothetical protein
MNKDDDEDTPMLVLEFHDGEYLGLESKTKLLLEISGGAERVDGPSFNALEEASSVLEYWCEKYTSPVATSRNITVFIGRENGDDHHIEPVARLDIVVVAGTARTTLVQSNHPPQDIGPTSVDMDDGVATVVERILSVRGDRV